MNRSEAARLARNLMNEHGFGRVPFEYDRSVRRFGAVHWNPNGTPRKLTLSERLVMMNDEKIVTDVILHEIAHLMAGFAHGHDAVWRMCAQSLGIRGDRCYDTSQVEVPKGDVVARCSCRVHHRHRMPRKGYQYNCRHCGDVVRFQRGGIPAAPTPKRTLVAASNPPRSLDEWRRQKGTA